MVYSFINNPKEAFGKALKDGILSLDRNAENFVENYMYMGTYNGIDQFKNINTRKYIKKEEECIS